MEYIIRVIGVILSTALLASAGTDLLPKAEPVVVGYGADAFSIGELLYETDFSDTNHWVFQIEKTDDPSLKGRIRFDNGIMDLYMPAIGCTAWLNIKFEGPVAIVYQVKCPPERINGDSVQARDINNFWHCSDPRRFNAVLMRNGHLYNGDFTSYHEMQGYYASTGGGGHVGNKTTRLRRYPRRIDGKDVPHLSLNGQDDNPEHLIRPGEWHTLQLVACDGLLQYIQDGRVVYEIKYGDRIMSESRADGTPVKEERIYSRKDYPAYTEGFFGFRMVRTHHQYRDLKIYRLDPK